MTRLTFIDVPQKRELAQYNSAIEAMVERLLELDGIKSIYQIGSVSSVGISDIDMMIVFADGAKKSVDPVRDLPTDTYLFTHQLYGVSDKYWDKLRSLTFFHNYKHLKSAVMPEIEIQLTKEDETKLQRQIALEFLVKMHTVLTVQLRYRILKLRSFLLEGKALIYDLEFLGINEGRFHQLVNQIIDWRANWFENKPSQHEVQNLVIELHKELEFLLKKELATEPLFVPDISKLRTSRNMVLENGAFHTAASGVVLPSLGLVNSKKRFNLLHRLNNFSFRMPLSEPTIGDINAQRFDLLQALRAYNSEYLPGYLVPASSLRLV